MMRAHRLAMWIVVNEEFHDDPLTQYVAPPRPYAGNRDFFVFVDTGAAGLKAHRGHRRTPRTTSKRFFEAPDEPVPADVRLKELVDQYKPKTIGLGIGGTRGMTRSLTDDTLCVPRQGDGPEVRRSDSSSAAGPHRGVSSTRGYPRNANPTTRGRRADRGPDEARALERGDHARHDHGRRRAPLAVRRAVRRMACGTWFQPDLRVQRRARRRAHLARVPRRGARAAW